MAKRLIVSNSPLKTASLGRRLGERLMAGSIVALMGELGCGKTLFTRGICRGLGVPARLVNSPTFIIVNEYRGRLPVFHLDLYRLDAITDIIDMGIADYFQRAAGGVMVIEWAEKMLPLLPRGTLEVRFRVTGAREREIEFTAEGANFEKILASLEKA